MAATSGSTTSVTDQIAAFLSRRDETSKSPACKGIPARVEKKVSDC
jgi:hypothetical protein